MPTMYISLQKCWQDFSGTIFIKYLVLNDTISRQPKVFDIHFHYSVPMDKNLCNNNHRVKLNRQLFFYPVMNHYQSKELEIKFLQRNFFFIIAQDLIGHLHNDVNLLQQLEYFTILLSRGN